MIILLLCYDILFLVGLLVYLPRALKRKRINLASLAQKFGSIGLDRQKESIWIQVVSVGEVNVIGQFLTHLQEQFNYDIVISTTTLTGNKLAKEKYGKFAKVIFFPYDISFVIRKVIALVRPVVFIAVETEIWPNLFYQLNRKGIPILIINGRISKKAFARYMRIRAVMVRVLRVCRYVAVQTDDYKEKFLALGVPEAKIIVSGNMKFESITVDPENFKHLEKKYAHVLKVKDKLLVVAGSTHPTEEEYVCDAYRRLKAQGLDFTLVIAPRHTERAPSIERFMSQAGIRAVRLSAGNSHEHRDQPVYILDTIGELLYVYSIADICFVGGTLAPFGGHNILEPIYFSKPTLFGPSMENFEDIKEIILRARAGIQVKDASNLQKELKALLIDEGYRSSIASRCAEIFTNESQGLRENLRLIAGVLASPAAPALPEKITHDESRD